MNPQPFKFHSFEDFFEFLNSEEKQIVTVLDLMIFEIVPNVKRKLSYNVPFYSVKKRICFIWPASVPWGNVKLTGVQLGFCQGNLLFDPENYLDHGNRKQVFSKTFFSLNEIEKEFDLIKHFLMEATAVDQHSK